LIHNPFVRQDGTTESLLVCLNAQRTLAALLLGWSR
jgi:hypothetical protein